MNTLNELIEQMRVNIRDYNSPDMPTLKSYIERLEIVKRDMTGLNLMVRDALDITDYVGINESMFVGSVGRDHSFTVNEYVTFTKNRQEAIERFLSDSEVITYLEGIE